MKTISLSVLLASLFFGANPLALADTPKDKKLFSLYYPGGCEENLDPNAAIHVVKPWFRIDNDKITELSIGPAHAKPGDAFTFSPDGDYVAISHRVGLDTEQVNFRKLETGANLGALLWNSKNERLIGFDSIAVQPGTLNMVGRFFYAGGEQHLLSWNGQSDQLNRFVLPLPEEADFQPLPKTAYGIKYYVQTPLTFEHQYYVRTLKRGGRDKSSEYMVQIVDWYTQNSLTLPNVSPEVAKTIKAGEVLNSKFGYAALLLNDQHTVQMLPFEAINEHLTRGEHQTYSSDEGGPREFSTSLQHEFSVRKIASSKVSPFIVTHTFTSELHLWNAKTGEHLKAFSHVIDFEVLQRMDLLAYSVFQKDSKGKEIVLYSLSEGREIGRIPDVASIQIDEHTPGVAFVTKADGSVMQVTERLGDSHFTYDVSHTGVQLTEVPPRTVLTHIQTDKGSYLVQIYRQDPAGPLAPFSLIVDFFKLDGSGQKALSLNYLADVMYPQFKLSPNGDTVVYTSSEADTAILHLDRLIEEH